MKKNIMMLLVFAIALKGFPQISESDSIKEVIANHDGKLNALDDRVLLNEADLGKLNKIKISGYVQSQWELYDKDRVAANEPTNTFYIRRARLKFTYEALDGVKFVMQPDFSTGNLALKDAYAVVNIPKLQNWKLWAGQMLRPDYEVEYSSGQREVLERSKVIRAIYPGEREIGVKLEYIGSRIPVKFQLMAMNGNFKDSQAKDVDSKKDIMARFVYSIKIPNAGIGIDLGPSFYYGGNRSKVNPYVLTREGVLDSIKVGDYLDKKWIGGEIQLFADILGGLAIKGEYIAGINSTAGATAVASNASISAKKAAASTIKNFSGYYIYFIKNIGTKNQFVAKYDYYDPNSKLSGDNAGSNVYFRTWTLAWQYYLNNNIRISVNYEMPKYEINATRPADYKDVTYGNTLGLRIQARF